VKVGSIAAGARAESLRAAAPIGPLSIRAVSFVRLNRGRRFYAAPQLIR
jgi:hypothetical protein